MSQTHLCLLFWLTGSIIVGCSPSKVAPGDEKATSTTTDRAEHSRNVPLGNVSRGVKNAASNTPDSASPDDLALMQGKWKFVQFLIGGDLLVDTSGQVVCIDGNRMRIPQSRKRPEKDLTFTLDSRKTPKQIDFDPPSSTHSAKSTQGIFRLTSDELIIVVSTIRRPEGFEISAADSDALNDDTVIKFILRRGNELSPEHSTDEAP